MRWQKIDISFSALLGLLMGEKRIFHKKWSNLPDDAKIVMIYSSERAGTLSVTIESSTFPELAEGSLVPDFPISVTMSVPSVKDHLDAILDGGT